jgi:hypothetical protein
MVFCFSSKMGREKVDRRFPSRRILSHLEFWITYPSPSGYLLLWSLSTWKVGLESLSPFPLVYDLKDHELSNNIGRDTICNFCNVNHVNWAWDSATMMAKCHRVFNPLPKIELVVALVVAAPNVPWPNAPNIELVVALVAAAPNAVASDPVAGTEVEE